MDKQNLIKKIRGSNNVIWHRKGHGKYFKVDQIDIYLFAQYITESLPDEYNPYGYITRIFDNDSKTWHSAIHNSLSVAIKYYEKIKKPQKNWLIQIYLLNKNDLNLFTQAVDFPESFKLLGILVINFNESQKGTHTVGFVDKIHNFETNEIIKNTEYISIYNAVEKNLKGIGIKLTK